MMTRIFVSACLALAACTATDTEVGSSVHAVTQNNGMRLNGMRLNGMRLNGMRLNGMRLNGMRLNGMRLNGSALGGFLVTGVDEQGNEITEWHEGVGMAGTELDGELEDGTVVKLRIDTVRQSTNPGDGDLFYYAVSVEDPASGAWAPACGSNDSGAVEAIPVAGVWDYSEGTATGGSHLDSPDQFTFGCVDAAIGKCVEWGYRPWQTLTRCETDRKGNVSCWYVPGSDYHQACTRLTRADYCGNGLSSTADGTLINVYDNIGIEDRDTTLNWAPEAEWSPDGANCISRKSALRHNPAPSCTRALLSSSCGKDWGDPNTLIMTDLVSTSRR